MRSKLPASRICVSSSIAQFQIGGGTLRFLKQPHILQRIRRLGGEHFEQFLIIGGVRLRVIALGRQHADDSVLGAQRHRQDGHGRYVFPIGYLLNTGAFDLFQTIQAQRLSGSDQISRQAQISGVGRYADALPAFHDIERHHFMAGLKVLIDHQIFARHQLGHGALNGRIQLL